VLSANDFEEARIIFMYPVLIHRYNAYSRPNEIHDDFLERVAKVSEFFITDLWSRCIKRYYITEKKIQYSYKIKKDDNRIVERDIILGMRFYLSMLAEIPSMEDGEMRPPLPSPAVLWVSMEIKNDGSAGLEDLIPLLHILWGARVKDENGKTLLLNELVTGEVLEKLRSLLGEKEEIEVRASEPIYAVLILYPCPPGRHSIRDIIYSNKALFYGLAVGDEGFCDVPLERIDGLLSQWFHSTRWFEGYIISHSSVVYIQYNINRIGHEKFHLPKDSWEKFMEHYGEALGYNIFALEWIAFLKGLLKKFEEDIYKLYHESVEKEASREVIGKLLNLKYAIIKVSEYFDLKNVAKIPETFAVYWKLLEYTGAKNLQDYIENLIHEISDMIYAEHEELRRKHETLLNRLVLLLSAAALLDGIVSVVNLVAGGEVFKALFSISIVIIIVLLIVALSYYLPKFKLTYV